MSFFFFEFETTVLFRKNVQMRSLKILLERYFLLMLLEISGKKTCQVQMELFRKKNQQNQIVSKYFVTIFLCCYLLSILSNEYLLRIFWENVLCFVRERFKKGLKMRNGRTAKHRDWEYRQQKLHEMGLRLEFSQKILPFSEIS